MFREAINKVLYRNNQALNTVIKGIKEESLEDTELILQLSIIQARSQVLEILTADLDQYELYGDGPEEIDPIVPPEPVPYFISEVENDDPETEDKDLKKIRQESKGFFG